MATVDPDGRPHVVPVVYAYDGTRLYTPIDAKPKRVAARQLRRVMNIADNPSVTLVIDDYSENWGTLAWVQVRGVAAIIEDGPTHDEGVRLLTGKYPQYRDMPLGDRPLIVIRPERILGWRADGS